jgi:uncharacterized membrane protein YuzA (DUF378 family)
MKGIFTMKIVIYISALLTVIGGLNWGLVGFFGFNAVEKLLPWPIVAQIVYCLVGIASIISTLAFIGCFKGVSMCKFSE